MEPDKKSNGAFVGLVIIIIILIVGGFYMWKSNQEAMERINTEDITAEESDELNSLDADINSTDTNTGVDVDAVY